MAPHSSTLVWKIPWTHEPGRLQSMESLRVGHDRATSLSFSLFTFMHWRRKWQPTPVFLPGESQGRRSLVSHRVGHDWSDLAACTPWCTHLATGHLCSIYLFTVICSVVSDSLHGPIRLPCPWNSLGKNTGVGCRFLLQGIFLIQGSNPGIPHFRQILYHLNHQGSKRYI